MKLFICNKQNNFPAHQDGSECEPNDLLFLQNYLLVQEAHRNLPREDREQKPGETQKQTFLKQFQ